MDWLFVTLIVFLGVTDDAVFQKGVNPCLFETTSISTGGYSYETTKYSSGLYIAKKGKCVKK